MAAITLRVSFSLQAFISDLFFSFCRQRRVWVTLGAMPDTMAVRRRLFRRTLLAKGEKAPSRKLPARKGWERAKSLHVCEVGTKNGCSVRKTIENDNGLVFHSILVSSIWKQWAERLRKQWSAPQLDWLGKQERKESFDYDTCRWRSFETYLIAHARSGMTFKWVRVPLVAWRRGRSDENRLEVVEQIFLGAIREFISVRPSEPYPSRIISACNGDPEFLRIQLHSSSSRKKCFGTSDGTASVDE